MADERSPDPNLVGQACTALFLLTDAVAAGNPDGVQRARTWAQLCRRIAAQAATAGDAGLAELWSAHAARVDGVDSLAQLSDFTRDHAAVMQQQISRRMIPELLPPEPAGFGTASAPWPSSMPSPSEPAT